MIKMTRCDDILGRKRRIWKGKRCRQEKRGGIVMITSIIVIRIHC